MPAASSACECKQEQRDVGVCGYVPCLNLRFLKTSRLEQQGLKLACGYHICQMSFGIA